jgi:hypothetical protein
MPNVMLFILPVVLVLWRDLLREESSRAMHIATFPKCHPQLDLWFSWLRIASC